MNPKWLEMHRAIPANPHIAHENLTVSFHLGGMRESLEEKAVSSDEAKRELTALIYSVVEHTPPQHVARVFRCAKIGQPVITLLGASASSGAVHAIASATQARQTLVVDPEFATATPVSIQSLVDCLFEELGSDICSARFSYSKGAYHPFTQPERQFIEDSTQP
jgi:hypothetical protein